MLISVADWDDLGEFPEVLGCCGEVEPSRAPLGPRNRSRSSRGGPFEMRKQHLDLLSLPSRFAAVL